ncbi:hypothetical protein ACNJIO_20865, partial [Mycobacterium tuberculosis]
RISATIRTARSRSSGGYLLDEPPDMTPSFPRTGVSGHAGAVHFPDRLDRVYVNSRARRDLNWRPRFDLNAVAARLARGQSVHTPLSQLVGSKAYAHSSYHRGVFAPARP